MSDSPSRFSLSYGNGFVKEGQAVETMTEYSANHGANSPVASRALKTWQPGLTFDYLPAELLIDELLPAFDVSEVHSIEVMADAATTYDAVFRANLAPPGIARVLFFLRALPGAITHGKSGLRTISEGGREPVTLRAFEAHGFRIIAENPPEELVIGLEGKFWLPSGAVCTPVSFRDSQPAPGTARAVWNFSSRQASSSISVLTTETRVLCADKSARVRFLPYWAVVRPGSGLIRRAMLKAIRNTAETRGPRS